MQRSVAAREGVGHLSQNLFGAGDLSPLPRRPSQRDNCGENMGAGLVLLAVALPILKRWVEDRGGGHDGARNIDPRHDFVLVPGLRADPPGAGELYRPGPCGPGRLASEGGEEGIQMGVGRAHAREASEMRR